ncbi:MAG TPA: choice-of-anchor D domain-containing protein [Candidatus Angelobacter sp.]|nr:choice-of-anchor D domain-containing protein [Candidatus Angelobacter sp.]
MIRHFCHFATVCLLGSALASSQTPTPTPTPAVPSSSHVFLIVEENTSYSTMTNTSDPTNYMPWLVGTGATFGHATNYDTDSAGSLLDYLWLSSGSCHGDPTMTDCVLPPGTHSFGCTGGSCVDPITDDNIFREMIATGTSWKLYAESIPSAGYMGVSVFPYDTHHNAAMWYSDIINSPAQQNNIVPFTQFVADLGNNQLPRYSIIIPDDNHDAHDGTPAAADSWLQTNIAPLLQQPFFQPCGDGLLIITFDNGDLDHAGQVYTAVIGPKVIPGVVSAAAYKHENSLRTILDALGITTRPGASATVSGMTDFFITPAPCPLLAPSPLSFPNQILQVPTSNTVTVTNGGDADMAVTSISASGDFTETNDCGSSVPARKACTVTVTFKPTAAGPRSGRLTVQDSASGSPHGINLSGNGVLLGLSSSSLNFGNQLVNTISATQSVTVTNTGSGNLSITGVSASDGYKETDNCSSLAPNGNCTVNISFAPATAGPENGAVTVFYGGTQSSIATAGTGVLLGLSATSVGFGTQVVNTTSATKPLTITNTGGSPITVTGINASASFTQNNNCSSLAANASCTVNVAFAPTGTGSLSGQLTVQYGGTQSAVNLNGTGTDFSVGPQTGNPASMTITAGQTATYNLSLSGSSFFTGSVNLSCSGAPPQSSCALSAPSLTVNGSTPVNFNASISTTMRSAAAPNPSWPQPPTALLLSSAILALLALLSRSRVRIRYAGAIAAVALSLALLISCGGGGHVVTTTGTPPGTYTVVVTANSGSASRTFNLTLVVN